MSGGNATSNNPETETPTQLSHSTSGENPTSGAGPSRQQRGRDSSTSPQPDFDGENERPGLDPASLTLLSACNTIIEDFRGRKCGKPTALRSIQSILSKAIQQDDKSLDDAFGRYLEIIENHERSLLRAEKRGHQDHSTGNELVDSDFIEGGPMDEPEPQVKRAWVDESEFPWAISDQIHSAVLSPSLDRSLKLLKCYAVDPKRAKRSLTNSPTCPEFPDSEWTNVLAGRAVNLDHVLSGYYSTSISDERTESVGEVEIKFGTISPTKLVSTAGDWSIAWNRTSRATAVVFPHRAGELGDYSEYIIGLFGATDILFHDRVIAYDRALRRRVGSRRDLELTDIHKFGDLKQLHMDFTGAAVC